MEYELENCYVSNKLCKVIEHYPNDDKCYHNQEHIINMIKYAYNDRQYLSTICNFDLFLVAIMFHDVVYTTGATDNEENSANMAEEWLNDYNRFQYDNSKKVSDQDIKFVVDLILSTKIGSNLDTEAKKILHDYDWMIFSDVEKLKDSDSQIILEAMRAGYSFLKALKGRMDFYKSLINKNIFVSEKYEHLNFIAQDNLEIVGCFTQNDYRSKNN